MVITPAIYLGDIFGDILVTEIISTFNEQNRTFVIKFFFRTHLVPQKALNYVICSLTLPTTSEYSGYSRYFDITVSR